MLGAVALQPQDLDIIIQKAASQHGVEAAAIRAVVATESSWNPSAYRYEAHLKDASWGLMQLLLSTAREVSNNKSLTVSELLKPEININLGTTYLAKLLRRYNGNIYDAVAAYNAGSVRHNPDGSYVNQEHVNRFKKLYLYYRGTGLFRSAALPFLAIGGVGLALYISTAQRKD